MSMNYQDLLATAQYCVDIKLANVHMLDKHENTPLFDQIQYLFQEIYKVSRFDPSDLLLSPEDYFALYCISRSTPSRQVHYQFGIDMLNPPSTGRIDTIHNLTTGKVVHMASLPDLEEGSIRVGFFPVRFEFSTARYDPLSVIAAKRLQDFGKEMSNTEKSE